jgi:hypothetical protein
MQAQEAIERDVAGIVWAMSCLSPYLAIDMK